ncbi:HK97 family phage major capsid protein [Kribbella rubisoli]|uniref:HK97 family phage major capsid protein n=1 Tax=Kribbella rubisoli TaxID=3075929 RepID=A0A4Q7WQI4_9ACTN|nr:phage major capsid protein [Kribbella rubisoli]RZU12450.1 HK97 family phage major capsid protein [Kribbella rubisoli]
MSQIIKDLRARRELVWTEANALANTVATENRSFNEQEEATWQRLNADLDAYDARIQQLQGQEQRDQAKEDAFGNLAGRPLDRNAPRSGDDADLDKAFRSMITSKYAEPIDIPVSGRSYYQPGIEQRSTLKSTATQALPVSVYDRIVQHMVESSAVLKAGATLINTDNGNDLQVPKSTAFSTAALFGEGATITASDPTLAVVTLKAYKYATYFEVSHELANDGNVDLLGFLARQAGESLALAYGNDLVNGTGTGQPTGVLTTATPGVSGITGTGTTLGTQGTAGMGTDILYNLDASLAEPYAAAENRAWLMRNASRAVIRKLKDTTGQPVVGADGNSFLGAPFVVDPFMPAMANLAESIAYGDFSRYFVRIAEGIRFERSDDFKFQTDMVAFRCVIRIDGALIDSNAIKTFANAT